MCQNFTNIRQLRPRILSVVYMYCNDIDVIVLFTSGPHLRHNYHGNKTLETMLSGSVEFVGHRLNRPVLLHLCVCRVLPINNATCTLILGP